jgi:hypothetical protein
LGTALQLTSRDLREVVVALTVGAEATAREALLMVKVNELVVETAPFASVTRTVTVWVDAADGVPLMTPVELSIVNPEGRVPESTANV